MKKLVLFLSVYSLLTSSCSAQPDLDKTLKRLNDGSVPYINVEQVTGEDMVILDARQEEEYRVSRIPGAIWIGYKEFEKDKVLDAVPDKDTSLVVYCSIGVRSEKIGEKLKEAGFTDVYNLYGGIFEWKNRGKTVVDQQGEPTEKVHAYSRYWGRFLKNAQKVY